MWTYTNQNTTVMELKTKTLFIFFLFFVKRKILFFCCYCFFLKLSFGSVSLDSASKTNEKYLKKAHRKQVWLNDGDDKCARAFPLRAVNVFLFRVFTDFCSNHQSIIEIEISRLCLIICNYKTRIINCKPFLCIFHIWIIENTIKWFTSLKHTYTHTTTTKKKETKIFWQMFSYVQFLRWIVGCNRNRKIKMLF